MFKINRIALLMGASTLLLAGQANATTLQVLLDEDFEDVTGIGAAGTVRTVADILTNNPTQLASSPLASFTNVGTGDASSLSFNVRRGDNVIDGTSGPAALGDTEFDDFFGASSNQFLVMGDDTGNLGGVPTGGTTAGSSSTMSIRFALDPITLSYLTGLNIQFDYVFDATNTANVDDFVAELVWADSSTLTLLSISAPSAGTRGTFNSLILNPVLAPAFLNFRLVEPNATGSSAVGLDNLKVTAVPEPSALALLGLGLLGLGTMRRKA